METIRRTEMNRLTAAAVAIAAMLALPATGNASQSFGSLLKNNPANGSDQCVEDVPGPCTLVAYINPNDAGDPVTSPAPSDGVIVRFRMKTSAAESVTFRLATIDKQGDVALAQGVGAGPTVTTQDTEDIQEFPARVTVKQGQHIALDAPSTHMVYNQGGNEYTYLYEPTLVAGQGPRGASGEPQGELLVQAVMEPDADRDGYGDETQDGCPTQASTHGACDTSAPSVKRLRLAHRSLKLRLSEAASLRIKIEKKKNGRFRNVRALTRTGKAGQNALSLGRRLGSGQYRVSVVATDAAGNRARYRFQRSR
jgi:hypothetical protein